MRDAATPKDHNPDAGRPATPTPQQRAAAIRTAAAEVLTRVEEWRQSPNWHDNDTNRRRYQRTAQSIATLEALPGPDTHDGIPALVDAIRPILETWRPAAPAPNKPSVRP